MTTYWENSCSFGLRYVSWNKYLIVSLVFSHLGFWSGNLFLIAPFPDLCLLVPFDLILTLVKIFSFSSTSTCNCTFFVETNVILFIFLNFNFLSASLSDTCAVSPLNVKLSKPHREQS